MSNETSTNSGLAIGIVLGIAFGLLAGIIAWGVSGSFFLLSVFLPTGLVIGMAFGHLTSQKNNTD